jgi:lipopolysaccharide export LptBFGC system permease protein LptF
MKKIITIILLVFAFTLTAQAQKGKRKMRAEKLSTEQQTILAVKKMTLSLDLTASQQNELKPLVAKKISDRKAHYKKMKATQKVRKKLSADERFAKVNERLDNQIAMKRKMKKILNKEQFEKFEKTNKNRKKKGKKMMRKKRMMMKKKTTDRS